MRVLAIDIGTGTQDILAFDTSSDIANCPKMVMPSPTALLCARIQQATARRQPLLLTGVTMGGGPAKGALKRHLQAGVAAYATPDAARTFDDDLAEVEKMGVTIVSPDEARRPAGTETLELELKDMDLPAIKKALTAFGVSTDFNALAVAVLDHGNAPPGTSDRLFRFQHMQRTLEARPELTALVHLASEVPEYLTRMKAVLQTIGPDIPTLLMDTGAAAVLGAWEDPEVSRHDDRLVVNAGNSHTIAFHLHGNHVEGMFEHHTHALSSDKLDSLLQRLTRGSLSNREVFEDGGHGCVILGKDRRRHFLAIVGPQRDRLAASVLKPYFAVPHGDMMLTGCFGLVRACALRFEGWREEIERALSQASE